MEGAPDLLFGLRNNFYLGAFQAAINSGDFQNLSEEDAIERDCLIYKSYIALGSYQDLGFFVPYLIGSISLVVLALGSISPGLLHAAISGFSTFFPDYQDRIASVLYAV